MITQYNEADFIVNHFKIQVKLFSYSTSLPSGIFEIIVLLILIKNNVETVKDITSAIGKAHHTAWSPPSFERMYAAGIKTTS